MMPRPSFSTRALFRLSTNSSAILFFGAISPSSGVFASSSPTPISPSEPPAPSSSSGVATVIGARLGHCIFYGWEYYSQHIIEIILPVRFEPEFRFTGYQGLASHGAAIGIIAGLWYYSRKVSHKSILWVLDRAVIPIALAGFFIRTGNLMNSEIVGQATAMPWGFRFIHSGMPDPETPRHPAQLYEALCYLATFFVLMRLYWRTNAKERQGYLFGVFLVLVFTARFIIEFVKEDQEAFEAAMTLNMGQLLSIPFVLVGLAAIWHSRRRAGVADGKKQ